MALLLLAVALAACRGGEGTNTVVLHPTPKNIPEVTDPRFVLHTPHTDTVPWVDFTALRAQTIGVGEGASHEMIGQVADIAIGASALYYVDSEYFQVRVYDFSGTSIAITGKQGKGPGEFVWPDQVAVTETDRGALLVVGDGIQITVFRQQDSNYVLDNTFKLAQPFIAGDLCVMHGHVYTIGYAEGVDGIIHKYTLKGEHVTSFGTLYKDPNPFVLTSLASDGSLKCNDKHRVLGYAHMKIPVLTGFSDAGEVVWRVKLDDVTIAPVTEGTERGRTWLESTLPETGETRMIKIIAGTPSDIFHIAYLNYGSGKTGKWHLFGVDAASGHGSYLGWYPAWQGEIEQPYLLGLDAERLYALKNRPYPQLGIYPRPDTLLP